MAANVSTAGNAPTLVADVLQQYVFVASAPSATPTARLENGGVSLPASAYQLGQFDENMVHPATAPRTETLQRIELIIAVSIGIQDHYCRHTSVVDDAMNARLVDD